MQKNYYITTTLPYVNSSPHIGFALEIIQADVLARYYRLKGYEVIFNFGTDEHGQKIYEKALSEGKDPQEYCDEYALKFETLKDALNLSYTHFIRTTDEKHIKAAQAFWLKCLQNQDIEKTIYKQKYCTGCELEKQESELEEGKCPLHPNCDIELIEEENYFFKFSKYQQKLLDFYKENPKFVIPESKYKEIKEFVKGGLKDFSISRLKHKMPWGIPVPNDPDHVMYVWFDALVNYISTLGWPNDNEVFNNFWPGVQVAGKDNLRQQTAIWQAMLSSAGLPQSKQIFIHGFIIANGQKISKSLGNVIDPLDLVSQYSTDSLRYYLLAKIHPFEDSDYTQQKFEMAYNADLANGLGNLVARVASLAEKSGFEFPQSKKEIDPEIEKYLSEYNFLSAMEVIWSKVKSSDQFINEKKVWTLSNGELEKALNILVNNLRQIATDLAPFLPDTSEKILNQFNDTKIIAKGILFPRLK